MVLCNNTRKVGSKLKKGIKTLAMWLIIGVIAIVLITSIMENRSSQITYSELITSIENGEVEKIKISSTGSQATVKMKDSKLEKEVSIPSLDSFMTYSQDYLKTGAFSLEEEKESIWITALGFITPFGLLAIFLVFWFIMMSGNNQNGTKSMTFGKSKARMINAGEKNRVTFDDVAGVDEEKEELQEIVEFLKNPKKFTDMGARIPKGVLLVGPPGTGKTLLARAVAGEAKVPFYYISGSDFVELFVGIGASRVRDMFKQAKMNAPCLIFIDEIDAVGRQRGTGLGGGHDEREQTLNQLLTEMDGFGANEGIIIIAATNRPDVLDPALLRPGRFDRQVTVSLPDKNARIEILKVHAKNKILDKGITLEYLAKRTPGFSGADLENLLNEAALLAVRRNKKAITMAEIDEATDRVLMGPAKVTKKYTDKEKKLVAFHEAGHAVMGLKLDGANEVQKITIIPRGHAGGYTMMTPKEESFNYTKNELLESICGLLGGRVAEEVTFHEITTGAHDDFKKATKIARSMVTEYGMSSLGPMMLEEPDGNTFLGRDYTKNRNISDTVAHEIDEEMRSIINTCYEKTKKIINENKDLLALIANTLLEEETITKEEIDYLVEHGHLPEEKSTEESKEDNTRETNKKNKKEVKKEDTKSK